MANRKHALPSPRAAATQPKERAPARLTGSDSGAAATSGGAASSGVTELSRVTARATAAENELQATKAELTSLHKDVELMLTTMAQVTQVRWRCAPN